jgi:hypothetical protein
VTGSHVTGNTAESGGGIINDFQNVLTLKATEVRANSAVSPDGLAQGGGILNGGTANLTDSPVTGNVARSEGGLGIAQGGGIYNGSIDGSGVSLTLVASPVTGNEAAGTTAKGGGIFNTDSVTLKASRVAGNTSDNCRPVGSVPGCLG